MELDAQATDADDEHRGPPDNGAVEWCGEVDAEELVFRSYGMPTGSLCVEDAFATLDASLAPSCVFSLPPSVVDDTEAAPDDAPPPIARQKRVRETLANGRVVRQDLGVGVTHPSWGVDLLE